MLTGEHVGYDVSCGAWHRSHQARRRSGRNDHHGRHCAWVHIVDDDVVIVASKIVSKTENRIVDLAEVTVSHHARGLAEKTGRDARLCQLYLDESTTILGVKGRHVVTIDRRGFQGTGAGVDMSNVGPRSAG